MTQVSYQRETNDWRGFTHSRQVYNATTGLWEWQTYTGAWSYQIVPKGARPTGSWTAAVVLDGQKGVDIKNLTAGYYWIFFLIAGQSPYAPIDDPIDLVIK